jgi:hypothetical protein
VHSRRRPHYSSRLRPRFGGVVERSVASVCEQTAWIRGLVSVSDGLDACPRVEDLPLRFTRGM